MVACKAGVFWRASAFWSSEHHLGFNFRRGLQRRDERSSTAVGQWANLLNKTCTARWGLVNTSHIQASWQNNVFWVQSPRLCVLLYLLFQIHSLIGREYAMCHGPKLTSSLGKQQLEVLSCIWSVWAPWKLGKFVLLAGVKQIFLTQLFFWRYTKHFRTCATGNSEFCERQDLLTVQQQILPLRHYSYTQLYTLCVLSTILMGSATSSYGYLIY